MDAQYIVPAPEIVHETSFVCDISRFTDPDTASVAEAFTTSELPVEVKVILSQAAFAVTVIV